MDHYNSIHFSFNIPYSDRRALISPGYRDGSDSLVSRDLNSNTVRVKQRIQAIRARKQRRAPSDQLSLVRYVSPAYN